MAGDSNDFGTSFDRLLAKALDAFLAEFGFCLWPAMTSAAAAHSQDAQSLRDPARQARLEKRQKEAEGQGCLAKDASSKDAPGTDAPAKDAQPPKVPTSLRTVE
jgi:hypothetical protein